MLLLKHFFRLNSKSFQSSFLPLLHLHNYHSSSPNLPSSKMINLSNLLQGRISHSHLLQIHAQVIRTGAHQDNLIATRLIGHYPSQFALRVFYQLHTPNLYPFNAIIRVLAEDGLCSLSFSVFKQLNFHSLWPNDLTFSFILKGCFRTSDANYVKQIHTHVLKLGFMENSFVCNGLLAVYAEGFKDLVSARKVFDDMPDRNAIGCWTCLISGFAKLRESEEVLQLFLSMIAENLRPNDDTMVSILSACSNMDIVDVGKWVGILSNYVADFDSENVYHDSVNTVLVYLYGKWQMVDKSRERFDGVDKDGKRSVIPWNAMLGAYVQNGCAREALNLFRLMMEVYNCTPNHVTMVSVLSACAQIGDLDLGMWVHEYLKSKRKDLLSSNRNLATALIDMYLKCGCLQSARAVFAGMMTKDVVSYNAMIMGLAMNGKEEEALRLFSEMQEIGLRPNGGTFLGVLCACGHSGLLEKGCKIFEHMSRTFSVRRNLEHYACYIDLLARMGKVEEAFEVAISMPFEPNAFVLGALLSGCLLHNRLELAKDVSRRLVKKDPENSAGYVMLSNAFASDCQWADVSGLRWHMRESGVMKQPGCSWVSIDGVIHEFHAGSPSRSEDGRILNTLDILLKVLKSGNS